LQLSSLLAAQVSLLFACTLQALQWRSVPQVCVPAAQLPSKPAPAQERSSPTLQAQA